jgi:hypothetical protein
MVKIDAAEIHPYLLIVIEDYDHVCVEVARVIHCFVGHSPSYRAITNDSNHVV